MTEEALKTLRKFEELPNTALKRSIQTAYMVDAITSYEMLSAARELVNLVSKPNA